VTYLLGTNVISELRKTHPDPGVLAWFRGVRDEQLYLSVISIGEIRRGIERLRRKDAAQAGRLEKWLDGLLLTFDDHIVSIDARIADTWGGLNVPDPLPVLDGLLAATAVARGWTLVTRNVADIPVGRVPVLNPFQATE
jgi:predicted nucleic acid-binding protein